MPPATAMLTSALSLVKVAHALRVTKFIPDVSRGYFARHLLLSRRSYSIVHADSSSNQKSKDAIDRSDCGDITKQFIPLVQEYEQQVSGGKLLFDPLQHHAARKLTRLQLALKHYDHNTFLEQLEQVEQCEINNQHQNTSNEHKKSPIAEQKMSPSTSIPIPRGFYIHGDVGTGKSLLLNNFCESAPALTSSKKRRLHFHSFLQEIHQRIHGLNKKLLQKHGRSYHVDTSIKRNPILQVAEQLSNEVTLLCIDEFQVTDVADAMMLSQFFGELWRRGVVVVATSNRPPQNLYEGGLNRGYFLPFLDLLEKYCVVHHLGDPSIGNGSEGKDYRRIRSGVDVPGSDKCGDYFYLTRGGNEEYTSQQLDQLFQSFEKHSHPVNNAYRPLILQVQFQRTISISQYHSNAIACFSFDELCAVELGSSDFHAIANHFQIVMIKNVPQLTLRYPDRARRFITLIDELYEAGCCLVCSAVDIPDRLFVGKASDGESTYGKKSTTNPDTSMETGDAVDVAQVQGTAVSELASVKELSFAFSRAASRLLEMCSKTWWEEKGAIPSIVVK